MPDENLIVSLTASEISTGLQGGKFSSMEVTAAYLSRIKKVDQKVHAFLSIDEQDMLDQAKFSENSLTQLPDGIRIEFNDETLSLKCGGIDDKKGNLSRKCFNGYQTNALNYIKEKHSDLLLSPKEIKLELKDFLKASK